MHFPGPGGSGLASSSSSSSTSGRESMDPIAELLSQLSGVRRVTQQSQPPMQSQLQLLQQQLQLERQQVQHTRERLERLPTRQKMAAAAAAASSSAPTTSTVSTQESSSSASSSFLLARLVPDGFFRIGRFKFLNSSLYSDFQLSIESDYVLALAFFDRFCDWFENSRHLL